MRWLAAVAAVAAFAVGLGTASIGNGAETRTAAVRLDGAPLRPELALTPDERSTGLMRRRQAPKDGMLFVFPEDTTGGFWMKNTLVPLRILFFDARGRRVRAFLMTPCRVDPCTVYDPRRAYRFALELPAGDRRRGLTLGPLRELRGLSRAAS